MGGTKMSHPEVSAPVSGPSAAAPEVRRACRLLFSPDSACFRKRKRRKMLKADAVVKISLGSALEATAGKGAGLCGGGAGGAGTEGRGRCGDVEGRAGGGVL